jgi:hypothetical protein
VGKSLKKIPADLIRSADLSGSPNLFPANIQPLAVPISKSQPHHLQAAALTSVRYSSAARAWRRRSCRPTAFPQMFVAAISSSPPSRA